MGNLLFFVACLLTAVGGGFLLAFCIIHIVTDHRLLLKMLRNEPVDMKYDEEKFDKFRFMFNLEGKKGYLIKIGMRRRSKSETFFKRWGKLCTWAAILLWLLEYYKISDWWDYLVILFMSVVVEFAILAVFSFITAVISNRCYKQAYKKYQPEK